MIRNFKIFFIILIFITFLSNILMGSPFDKISVGSEEYRALSIMSNSGIAKKYSNYTIGDYRGKELTRYQFAIILTQLLTNNGQYDPNHVISTFSFRAQQITKQIVKLYSEELSMLGIDYQKLKFLKKDPLDKPENPIITIRDQVPEKIKKQQEILKRKISHQRFEMRHEKKLKRLTNNISADTITNHLFLKNITVTNGSNKDNSIEKDGFNIWDRLTFSKMRKFGDHSQIKSYIQVLGHNGESEFSRKYFNEYIKLNYTNPWWEINFGNNYLDYGESFYNKFIDGVNFTYKKENSKLSFYGGSVWREIKDFRYNRSMYGADFSDILYFNNDKTYLRKFNYGLNFTYFSDDSGSSDNKTPKDIDVSQFDIRSNMSFKNNLNWFLEYSYGKDNEEFDNFEASEDQKLITGLKYHHDSIKASYRYIYSDKDYMKYSFPLSPTIEHYFKMRYKFDYWFKLYGEYKFSVDSQNTTPIVSNSIKTNSPSITFEILPSNLFRDLKWITKYSYLEREDDKDQLNYDVNELYTKIEDVIFNTNVSLYTTQQRRYNSLISMNDKIKEIYGIDLYYHFSPQSRGNISYVSDAEHKNTKEKKLDIGISSDINEEYSLDVDIDLIDHAEYLTSETDFFRKKLETSLTRNIKERRIIRFSFGYEDSDYNDHIENDYTDYIVGTDYFLKF